MRTKHMQHTTLTPYARMQPPRVTRNPGDTMLWIGVSVAAVTAVGLAAWWRFGARRGDELLPGEELPEGDWRDERQSDERRPDERLPSGPVPYPKKPEASEQESGGTDPGEPTPSYDDDQFQLLLDCVDSMNAALNRIDRAANSSELEDAHNAALELLPGESSTWGAGGCNDLLELPAELEENQWSRRVYAHVAIRDFELGGGLQKSEGAACEFHQSYGFPWAAELCEKIKRLKRCNDTNWEGRRLTEDEINVILRTSRCFAGADLSNVDFKGPNIDSFVSGDYWPLDFRGADLRGAKLSGDQIFDHSNFSGALLSGAILRGSSFRNCNFTDADLSGVDASVLLVTSWDGRVGDRHTDFTRAWFHNANLMEANLKCSILREADFSGAELSGVNWDNALLEDSNGLSLWDRNRAYWSGAHSDPDWYMNC